jgi:hypothetical protein
VEKNSEYGTGILVVVKINEGFKKNNLKIEGSLRIQTCKD